MRVNFFAIKSDYRLFLRENTFRFIVGFLFLSVFAGLGIAAAYSESSAATLYLSSNNVVVGFFRRERGLFTCFIAALFECIIMAALCFLCALKRPTVYLSYAVIAYKSYFGFKCLFIVMRYFKLRAVLFTVLFSAHLLVTLFVLLSLTVLLIDRQACFCRGVTGAKEVLRQAAPALIILGILLFALLILLPVSKILM